MKIHYLGHCHKKHHPVPSNACNLYICNEIATSKGLREDTTTRNVADRHMDVRRTEFGTKLIITGAAVDGTVHHLKYPLFYL